MAAVVSPPNGSAPLPPMPMAVSGLPSGFVGMPHSGGVMHAPQINPQLQQQFWSPPQSFPGGRGGAVAPVAPPAFHPVSSQVTPTGGRPTSNELRPLSGLGYVERNAEQWDSLRRRLIAELSINSDIQATLYFPGAEKDDGWMTKKVNEAVQLVDLVERIAPPVDEAHGTQPQISSAMLDAQPFSPIRPSAFALEFIAAHRELNLTDQNAPLVTCVENAVRNLASRSIAAPLEYFELGFPNILSQQERAISHQVVDRLRATLPIRHFTAETPTGKQFYVCAGAPKVTAQLRHSDVLNEVELRNARPPSQPQYQIPSQDRGGPASPGHRVGQFSGSQQEYGSGGRDARRSDARQDDRRGGEGRSGGNWDRDNRDRGGNRDGRFRDSGRDREREWENGRDRGGGRDRDRDYDRNRGGDRGDRRDFRDNRDGRDGRGGRNEVGSGRAWGRPPNSNGHHNSNWARPDQGRQGGAGGRQDGRGRGKPISRGGQRRDRSSSVESGHSEDRRERRLTRVSAWDVGNQSGTQPTQPSQE